MHLEINQLINHFTNICFRIRGVYHYNIDWGSADWQKTHPYPGFIFPLSGQAQFHFDGSPYLAEKGTVIHGGANMGLDKKVLGRKNWEFISVLYEVQGNEPSEICLPESHFELNTGKNPELNKLAGQIWKTYHQPGRMNEFKAETLFRNILEEVFVCAGYQTEDSSYALFQQISNYIHENYMEPLSVGGLVVRYQLNENQLFYLFSKYAGMGPGNYMKQYRLEQAKQLLITTSLSVSQVADIIGYQDALYFSRTFKRKFGMSPSLLREKFRNCPFYIPDKSIQK